MVRVIHFYAKIEFVLSGGSGPVSAAWRRREATGLALRIFLAQATGARTAGFSRIA